MSEFGTYRQRLVVQQEHPVADTGGGNVMGWTTLKTVWAYVEPMRGQEKLLSGASTGTVTYRITMRYDSAITSAMRLLLGSRVFNIRSVLNEKERNHTLIIFAEEGVVT